MEIFGLLKQIAELGIPGLMMSLFVILYLRERSEHNKTRDKYVQAALSVKDLFHKVMETLRIIGDENSTDFEECKHRLDQIEKTLEGKERD